jgi:serralysin
MCLICGIVGAAHEDNLVSTQTYVTTSSKPVASLSQAITYLTTQWPGAAGTLRTWVGETSLSYSIPSSAPEAGSQEASGFKKMTTAQKAAAREAFELWDDLIAVSLTETTSASADISFAYSTKTIGGGNYARTYTSFTGTSTLDITRAHVWLNASTATHDTDSDMYYGGYGRLTYIHEIGHTLGLSHPGTYDAVGGGSITYARSAEYAQDTRQFTTMSYFRANSDGSGTDHVGSKGTSYAATPLLHDIAAIQAKYGADMTTRTGNTVYGFGNTSGRDAFDFKKNPNPVVAIWDAGGIDTLNVSGFSTNQKISLVPGTFSDVGHLTKNVAIAFGTTIENAVGGSGADQIEGNAAANLLRGGAGNDTIWGGAGNDTLHGEAGADLLYGGPGRDEFVFATGGGADRIGDFQPGTDVIRLTSVTGFSKVALTAVGGGTKVTWGTSDSVLVSNVAKAQLTSASFVFGSGPASSAPAPAAPGEPAKAAPAPAKSAPAKSAVAGVSKKGGPGRDDLVGGVGADTLSGMGGNDRLEGGPGADRLDGGSGFDTASYASSKAAVKINLATGVHTGDAKGDTFKSIERYDLTPFDDVFVGSKRGEVIMGGDGNDRIDGGGGNDKLIGGSGADLFVFGPKAGADTILDFEDGLDRIDLRGVPGLDDLSDLSIVSVRGGTKVSWHDGSVVLTGVSKSQLTAADFLFAAGTTVKSATTTTSKPSGMSLTGDSTGDTLIGGAAADKLYGMGGNDRLEGGPGADRLDGGSGFDTASYASSKAAVKINLATGVHTGDAKGDTFKSIERYDLTPFDDVFVGSKRGEVIMGGDGNDRIDGGGGNDKLIGGSGADLFVFGPKAGADTILDFEDGLDRIDLRGVPGLDDLSDLSIVSVRGGTKVSWHDGSVVLTGVSKSQLTAADFLF